MEKIANHIDLNTQLAEIEALTRDYARYAKSAGGMSAMLGGLLCLLSFAIGAASGIGQIWHAVLIVLPWLWLLARAWFVSHYYQRFGRVEARPDRSRQRLQRQLSAGVAILVAISVLGWQLDAPAGMPSAQSPQMWLFCALLLLIPPLAWFWLHTPLDLVIGTFLLCQAALAMTGRTFAATGPAVLLVPAALVLIAQGWRDHRRFLDLRQRMLRMHAPEVARP